MNGFDFEKGALDFEKYDCAPPDLHELSRAAESMRLQRQIALVRGAYFLALLAVFALAGLCMAVAPVSGIILLCGACVNILCCVVAYLLLGEKNIQKLTYQSGEELFWES